MEAASPARFRPTWQQALARGLVLGSLVSAAGVAAALIAALLVEHPPWLWPALVVAPPLIGMAAGALLRGRVGAHICARGIRTAAGHVAPWSRVVDLRAERRGARTVVSVYLDSGASLQLAAPYDGELLAADPQFEVKVFALSNLWRSRRVGGLLG